jgi:membrane-associated phospholipid phosphatase
LIVERVEDIPAVASSDERSWRHQRWMTIGGGWILSFMIGVASAELASSFGDWNHGFAWERAMLTRIHTPLPRAIDALMMVFPWFGTNISLIPAVAAVCWWLWAKRGERRYAVRLAVVQLGSYLLNPSLKALFDRERPDLFPRRGWYGWSSYPSGHAIASVSVLLTLAIIIERLTGKRWGYYTFIPIMLASLYSRMYLGVHWPTDVLSGVLVGAVWLLATTYAFRANEPTANA